MFRPRESSTRLARPAFGPRARTGTGSRPGHRQVRRSPIRRSGSASRHPASRVQCSEFASPTAASESSTRRRRVQRPALRVQTPSSASSTPGARAPATLASPTLSPRDSNAASPDARRQESSPGTAESGTPAPRVQSPHASPALEPCESSARRPCARRHLPVSGDSPRRLRGGSPARRSGRPGRAGRGTRALCTSDSRGVGVGLASLGDLSSFVTGSRPGCCARARPSLRAIPALLLTKVPKRSIQMLRQLGYCDHHCRYGTL